MAATNCVKKNISGFFRCRLPLNGEGGQLVVVYIGNVLFQLTY